MSKTIRNEDWLTKLTRAVQDAGQEIIDRAPDIAGTSGLLSRMTITIDFNPETSMLIPTITVDKEYACKRAIDRLNMWKPEYMSKPVEKGEKS